MNIRQLSSNLFALLALVVGIFLIASGMWTFASDYNFAHYSETSGAVQSIQVQMNHGKMGTSWSPSIDYKYKLDGKEYLNQETPDSKESRIEAQASIDVLLHGNQVTVYYNPKHAEFSTLSPKTIISRLLMQIIAGVVLFTVAYLARPGGWLRRFERNAEVPKTN